METRESRAHVAITAGRTKGRNRSKGHDPSGQGRLRGGEQPLPGSGLEGRTAAGFAGAADAFVAELTTRVIDGLGSRLAELLPQPGPELLDRRGLAQFLGVSLPTVDRLRAEGLPTLMVVESPRFERERVLAWLRAQGAQALTGDP